MTILLAVVSIAIALLSFVLVLVVAGMHLRGIAPVIAWVGLAASLVLGASAIALATRTATSATPLASLQLRPAGLAAAEGSTVEVSGEACKRVQDGTGFFVAPNVVATNAHVVAGDSSTTIVTANGKQAAGTVVAFDPVRDLALVRVWGLSAAPLSLGAARSGSNAVILGHPRGEPQVAVTPAIITQEVAATGTDLYDHRSTVRDVYVLGSDVAPGDSGAPVVDSSGTVVGITFAISPDRAHTAYALTTTALSDMIRAGGALGQTRATSTEGCVPR